MNYTIQGYFDYIKERQKIWEKKTAGEPFPWTEDPILQKYKFCCVFREDDAGTKWFMENIGNLWWQRGLIETIWRTIIYRTVNNPKFFDALGFPGYDNIEEYIKKAKIWLAAGNKFRSDAYLILYPPKYGHAKIDQFEKALFRLAEQMQSITYKIAGSDVTAEQAWKILQMADGVGPFIAYEIWCDLVLCKALPFTEDDFVNIGPGAKPALYALAFPSTKDLQYAIRALQGYQKKFLPIDFKHLTLRSIESGLCEYRKYVNLSNGKGKKRAYILTPKE